MAAKIIVTGRGPQFDHSRITVYDVLAETQAGATPEEIAGWFHLSVEDVQVALQYIEEHKDKVQADWRKIQERHARGNPPEVQAKIDALHAKRSPLFAEILNRIAEREKNGHAGASGGREHRRTGSVDTSAPGE